MWHMWRQRLNDLATKNWHVKEKKCALFLPEVEFLGHVVSAERCGKRLLTRLTMCHLGRHLRVCGRCRAFWDWQTSIGYLWRASRWSPSRWPTWWKRTRTSRGELKKKLPSRNWRKPSPVPLSCKFLMRTSRMKSGWMPVTTLSAPRWL